MTKFTASNGLRVYIGGGGAVCVTESVVDDALDSDHTQAVREFFLHERDQELGRWRFEDSDYVVYPYREGERADEFANPVDLTIVCEATGERMYYTRAEDDGHKRGHPWESPWSRAARAYFAAHPEPKPLPTEPHTAWVDKYGTDIWWVNGRGVLQCCASPGSDPAGYAPFTQLVKAVSNDE